MAGTPFAIVDDVAGIWRPLTSAEQGIADNLILRASATIRAEYPGIDAQVSSGAVDADNLTMVTAGMVKRAMISPNEGVTQESNGTGPYTHSQTYANPLGNIFLTAADRMLIEGRPPSAVSATFGNDTGNSAASYQTVYGW